MHNKIPANATNWFHKGKFINLNGIGEIFCIDDGEKHLPIILLIHGFPTSSWDFEKIWPLLIKQYRLISIDMLGFGFSSKPNERKYTIHRQADIYEAILAELEIEQFHILAHDYGDTVAQELLARQIDKISEAKILSCCLLNGGLFPETHQALLIQKLLLSPLGPLINRFTGYQQFCDSFSSVFGEQSKPSQEELKTFWELINYNQGKHVFHNLITYMRDRKQHRTRWVGALQKTQVPIALINGSVDPVSGRHLVSRYKELDCRLDYLAELPSIGHYPQCEDASQVASHCLGFLSSLRR